MKRGLFYFGFAVLLIITLQLFIACVNSATSTNCVLLFIFIGLSILCFRQAHYGKKIAAIEDYTKAVEQQLEDSFIPSITDSILSGLQAQGNLDDEEAAIAIVEGKRKHLSKTFYGISKSGSLHPDQWLKFQKMSRDLGVEITASTKAEADQKLFMWRIQNAPLESIDVPISLNAYESCYFCMPAEWMEHRTVTTNYGYSGGSVSFKIMKGVRYRIGGGSRHSVKREELQVIDTGKVYLTNKRLIFMGRKKNTSITMNKILAFIPHKDAVEVQKDNGRNPIIVNKSHAEVCGIVLSRLLNES